MKEKTYYYYEGDDFIPVIKVVLIYDGMNVARGVAVKSVMDAFDPNHDKARLRALRAIKKRKLINNEFKDIRAIRILSKHKAPFLVHSELNPQLSFFERKLLFGKYSFDYNKTKTPISEQLRKKLYDSYLGPHAYVEGGHINGKNFGIV